MTKFTIALREIGTYKEVLRSQVNSCYFFCYQFLLFMWLGIILTHSECCCQNLLLAQVISQSYRLESIVLFLILIKHDKQLILNIFSFSRLPICLIPYATNMLGS